MGEEGKGRDNPKKNGGDPSLRDRQSPYLVATHSLLTSVSPLHPSLSKLLYEASLKVIFGPLGERLRDFNFELTCLGLFLYSIQLAKI